MQFHRYLIHSALIAAVYTTGAGAAPKVPKVPKVLDRAVAAGVEVVRQFPAASGLTGWVLAQGGRHSVVYTTADGKTLLAGALIDELGTSLSERYEEEYVPRPDLTDAYAGLDKSAFVTEGATDKPKRILYAFVDANCPYCHHLWRALQPYQTAGLQVRWIPVATLGATSMPKAIAVLGAPDRTAAFRRMHERHGQPWTPGAKDSERAAPAVAAAIRRNGELMQSFGVAGTPGVVWRDAGGKVRVRSGMPRLSELPAMTGLPEQKLNDPVLEKFR